MGRKSVSGDVNLTILRGRLSSPSAEKVLPSGDRIVQLEVTTRPEGAATSTVPVVWVVTRAPAWDAGTEVVVVGEVRRRFFRAGGVTASRTEVVAEAVIPASQNAKVAAKLAAVLTRLG